MGSRAHHQACHVMYVTCVHDVPRVCHVTVTCMSHLAGKLEQKQAGSSSKDSRHSRQQQQQQQQGQQAAVAGTAGSSSRQELLVGKGALKPCPARIFSHPQLMKLPHKTLNKWWKSFAGGKRFVPRVATPHASSPP